MCLGDCEQVSEQARGNEREEKEGDHVKSVHEGRRKRNVCVCMEWRRQLGTHPVPATVPGTACNGGPGNRAENRREGVCLLVCVCAGEGAGLRERKELKEGMREQASLSISESMYSERVCGGADDGVMELREPECARGRRLAGV